MLLKRAMGSNKLSFYLVLGGLSIGSLWLIIKLLSSSSRDEETASSRVKTRSESSSELKTASSSKKNEKEGLFTSIWSKSGSAKDRFGRDLKARAVIENETQNMKTLFESGDLGQMKARLDDLLKRYPNVPEYIALLGDYHLALDNYEEAEATVRQLLELDPDNLFARETLARTLAVRGNMDEAREELNEVLEKNPGSESALRKLVAFGEVQGDPAQGIADLRKQIAKNPKNGVAYVVLAESLLERGNTQEAYKASLEGVKNAPMVAGNYRNLSIYYSIQGDAKKSLEYARPWAEREDNPQYQAVAQAHLLHELERSGNVQEACETALRMDSDDPEVQAAANAMIARCQKQKTR